MLLTGCHRRDDEPVGPILTDLDLTDLDLDIPDDWSDFGYDEQSTPSIPIDPALSSIAPAQIPASEVNGQDGRSTACGKGPSADEYPGGLA